MKKLDFIHLTKKDMNAVGHETLTSDEVWAACRGYHAYMIRYHTETAAQEACPYPKGEGSAEFRKKNPDLRYDWRWMAWHNGWKYAQDDEYCWAGHPEHQPYKEAARLDAYARGYHSAFGIHGGNPYDKAEYEALHELYEQGRTTGFIDRDRYHKIIGRI